MTLQSSTCNYQMASSIKFYSKFEDPVTQDDFFEGLGVEDENLAYDDAPFNVRDEEDEDFQIVPPVP